MTVRSPYDAFPGYRDVFGHVAPIPADHGQRRVPDEGFFTGPEIGDRLPEFTLDAASGRRIDFHHDRGASKAAVVFFRSAVWCPPCMTQLVEFQAALPQFRAAGVKLYAISYDDRDALAAFAEHHRIGYPLLSDPESQVIDRFGIRNHFVTRDQVPYYGIPFPGTYLVDTEGIVAAKFFGRSLAQRTSAEAVIDAALGQILLGHHEPRVEIGDDEVRISATCHGGGGTFRFGLVRQIIVRIALAPGLHIYGSPVPEGMVATSIRISGPPGLHAGEMVAPPTRPLRLPGLAEALPVWDDHVDFVIPVTVDDRIAGMVAGPPQEAITVEVQVRYQVCDDQVCRLPRSQTVLLTIPVTRSVGHQLTGALPGTIPTTMDARKFLLRRIARDLLRSPIKGLRYLLTITCQLWRGPSGRGQR